MCILGLTEPMSTLLDTLGYAFAMSRKNLNGVSAAEYLGHLYGTDEILSYPFYDNPHNRYVLFI